MLRDVTFGPVERPLSGYDAGPPDPGGHETAATHRDYGAVPTKRYRVGHFDKNCKDWDGREAEILNSTSVGLRVAKTQPQYARDEKCL
jgi:hypothetical protein